MRKKCTLEGKEIAYTEAGIGPALLFLHGFMESGEIWNTLASELSDSYTLIIPDLPGHGDSDSFSELHSMEFMAQCVKQCLGKKKEVVLVGHSMGGYVALAFAELFPEIVKGVVLFHSTPTGDSDIKKADRLRAIEVVRASKREFITTLIPKLYAEQNRIRLSANCERMKEVALQMSSEGITAALAGMRIRPDRSDVLKSKKYYSLIISGTYDEIIPVALLRMIATESTQIGFAEFAQSGHMGFAEEPEQSLSILSDFFTSCYR